MSEPGYSTTPIEDRGGGANAMRRSVFVRRAVASRLLTDSQLSQVREQLPAVARDDDASLAKQLIETGVLSRWQVEKLWAGKTSGFFVGQYKILDLLGEGGMGKVYRAEHTFMLRRVALKVLPPKRLENPKAAARFLREVHAASALAHPNIVTVFDAGQQDRVVYMAMELVDGLNLEQLIKRNGAQSPSRSADAISQAAEGLHYAYQQGIVHRDIKPQNLMLSRSGTLKILDMGLARWRDGEGDWDGKGDPPTGRYSEMLTDAGTFCGTVSYISVEQAREPRNADTRSDIYSLGCTCYYLLTGKHAFSGGKPAEVIARKMNGVYEPIRKLTPTVPEGLAQIVDRMMKISPSDRYANPAEVVDALRPFRAADRAMVIVSADSTSELTWLQGPPPPDSSEDPIGWMSTLDEHSDVQTKGASAPKAPPEPMRMPNSVATLGPLVEWWTRFARSNAKPLIAAVLGLLALLTLWRTGTQARTVNPERLEAPSRAPSKLEAGDPVVTAALDVAETNSAPIETVEPVIRSLRPFAPIPALDPWSAWGSTASQLRALKFKMLKERQRRLSPPSDESSLSP